MTLVMHGKQSLLYQIFHIIRQPGEAPAQESPQMRTQFPQKPVVGRGIAGHAADQQIPESYFAGAHAALSFYSLKAWVWLQVKEYKKLHQ